MAAERYAKSGSEKINPSGEVACARFAPLGSFA
jgi:hypothetical protein